MNLLYNGYNIVDCNNYPCIYLPSHPRAYKAGWVYIHILEAEKLLGRPLEISEVIHHKDSDRYNYSASNLMVFKTDSDHQAYHGGSEVVLLEDGSYIATSLRDIFRYKTYWYDICDCGNIKLAHNLQCRDCYSRFCQLDFYNKFDRNKLKVQLCYLSILEISRIYSCSDNYIRKVCKRLGLPFKRQDLHSLSYEDWILL